MIAARWGDTMLMGFFYSREGGAIAFVATPGICITHVERSIHYTRIEAQTLTI